MAREPDLTSSLARTRVPIFVACGEGDDAWTPKTQTVMARRLGVRIAVIADAAHTPNEDRPRATVDELLGFWAAVDRNG
jgi:pimeloyl-ACP methyl ester carboxylesterase